jgi:MscS family membrane protein
MVLQTHGTRVFLTLLLAAILLVAGGLCGGAWAQDETPDSPAEATPLADIQASVDLSSPRATLSTFLNAMNAVKSGKEEFWSAALECIYLKDLEGEERVTTGEALANQLFDVLNGLTIDLEAIPDTLEERSFTAELGESGDIPLEFLKNNDDDFWRFRRSFLEREVEGLQETADEQAEEAEPIAKDVNPLLATPRRTMQTFIEGVNTWDDGGTAQALLALDLSWLPENIREETGEGLALDLKYIFDHDKLVVYQSIPEYTTGENYVHLHEGSRRIEIVPIPVGEDTDSVEWKFSQASLKNIDKLLPIFYNRPLVAGAVDTSGLSASLRLQEWMFNNYPVLTKKVVILENWQWLGMFISILLGMIISRIIAFILLRLVRRYFSQERLKLDKKLERDFVRPLRVALMAWVWWIALKPLDIPPEILNYLKTVIVTISSSSLVWAVYRLVDIIGTYIAEKALKSENKYDDMVVPLVVRSLKVFVMLAGVMFVAQMNDWNYRAALAGVGIGGLAFALAAQDTLGNLFGSLTVMMDRPFQIGDWVQIGDVDGNVESVGIRSTRIRTFYNSMITVPNAQLTSAIVDNYGARRFRRTKMNLGITYDTPPDKIAAFCEGIRELIRKHPYTRKDYFHVYLNTFGDSSLNILLYCFHECPDWSTELRERERLLLDIIRLAERMGVEFAFPTSTLYVNPGNGSPCTDELPIRHENAMEQGRKLADDIVHEYMGKTPQVPPPVTFEMPAQGADEIGDNDAS